MTPKSKKRKSARRKWRIAARKRETLIFAAMEDQVANEIEMFSMMTIAMIGVGRAARALAEEMRPAP